MDRELSPAEKQYNTESLLCEELWEFHPEFFNILTASDREELLAYYPQDLTNIPDVFTYRKTLLHKDPSSETRARAVFAKVLRPIGLNLPE